MHEYSVVQSLIDLCEKNAKNANTTKINKITIKVGVLSGVEPQLLATAYETFKIDTMCSEAALEIIIQDIEIKCNQCHKKSLLKKYEFICPVCGSENLDIIDGEEMFLMSLECE